jgi:fumarylacetoacetate (FAA) hydrolase family protein
MSLEKSKTWPEVFLKAVNVGSNLEEAKKPFLIMVLNHCLVNLSPLKDKYSHAMKSTEVVIKVKLCIENSATEDQIKEVQKSAADAVDSAYAAKAYYASKAANAANAAAYAANAAAYAANAAASAYDYFSDELIKILDDIKLIQIMH